MIVVISPEKDYENETYWVNKLLEAGLEHFHLRKPNSNERTMRKYIQSIDSDFRNRVVLHSHYNLGTEFGLLRIHLPEYIRENLREEICDLDFELSTSVHSMGAFNILDAKVQYGFLSPFYESISKVDYGKNSSVLNQLQFRTNHSTKLIALGGIDWFTLSKLRDKVDGFALLGAVWNTGNPLKIYKKCKELDQLF